MRRWRIKGSLACLGVGVMSSWNELDLLRTLLGFVDWPFTGRVQVFCLHCFYCILTPGTQEKEMFRRLLSFRENSNSIDFHQSQSEWKGKGPSFSLIINSFLNSLKLFILPHNWLDLLIFLLHRFLRMTR